MSHKLIAWVKAKCHAVLELRDDQRSIAAGVSIGFFWGFTPLLGLKTLFSFLTAWVFRANKVAAVIAVSLHDLLLPLYPLYLLFSYRIGLWVLHPAHPKSFKQIRALIHPPTEDPPDDWWLHPVEAGRFLFKTVGDFLHAFLQNIHFLLPLLVGTMILAIPICIGTYFFTLSYLRKLAANRASKEMEAVAAITGIGDVVHPIEPAAAEPAPPKRKAKAGGPFLNN